MESSPKLKPQGTTNSSQETLSKATHYSPLTEIVRPKGKTTLRFLTKKLQPKWNKEVNFEANEIKIRKEIDQESLHNLLKDFATVSATKRHTTPDKFQFIELSNGFSDESMRYFCLMLSKNFVDLKKLVLVLKGSGKGMEMLGFSISRSLTNLKHLSLRFNQTTQLNDSLLRTLITQITTHLVHLQHFEFACFVSPLSDAGVEVFARKLCRNLVKLKELILCFEYSTALSSKCVSTLGAEIANNLLDLEYLKLRFASCPDIGSQAGIDIGNKIPTTLINLTHLLLEFTNCKFWADNSLQIIAREINQNLVNLKQLKLDFNSCSSISEEDLINLGHEMSQSKIHSLRSLTLIFFQCRGTTDGGLEGLSAGINEKWKDMKYLQMSFYLTGQIGDRGLEALIPPICKHWQNLEELNLSFSANKDISDQGLQIVGTHVGTYLTKLQKLKLNFAACHQVADAGVENLIIPLYKNLKNLKELALPLNECFNLTDKALQVISQIPQDMQSLSSLDLAFTSEEISNHGLERIADEIIEYLPQLQKLSLDFPFCSKLEDGTDERLRQRLSFIPDLYVRQIYE